MYLAKYFLWKRFFDSISIRFGFRSEEANRVGRVSGQWVSGVSGVSGWVGEWVSGLGCVGLVLERENLGEKRNENGTMFFYILYFIFFSFLFLLVGFYCFHACAGTERESPSPSIASIHTCIRPPTDLLNKQTNKQINEKCRPRPVVRSQIKQTPHRFSR